MVTLIRDYLDALSSLSYSSSPQFEILNLTFSFFGYSLLAFFKYFFTFGWLRDILYLPISVPQLHKAILSEKFFYEDINYNLFNLVRETSTNFFIIGFLNSFFLCLPLSTIHFLNLRRLCVQGVPAGIVSTLGSMVGQFLFIALTIFGFRAFIIPWFSLDPLNYLLGLGLLFWIVYDMGTEKLLRPVSLSDKKTLRNIFCVSFLLSWTEQSSFCQYLSNVNLSSQASAFELPFTAQMNWTHTSYLIGILFGHLIFSSLFIWLTLTLKNQLLAISQLPYSIWLKRTNNVFLVCILGLSFSSLPYYSWDYLFTGPLGFISQDKSLDKSFFSQKDIKDSNRLLTSMDVIFPFSIDTDTSFFDRAEYGEQPGNFQRKFEELNYQGEYAWLSRRDKKPNLYSSGQTTKTLMQDLFKKTNVSTGPTGPTASSDETETQATQTQSQKAIAVPRSIQALKLKNRYEHQYEEKSVDEMLLVGQGFDDFPPLKEYYSVSPTEKTIKEKYYANKLYKTLLNCEIDAFLQRQPSSYLLSEEEEKQVFNKRYLLHKYYDTLRHYQQIPWQDEFQSYFHGSKTFVDRIYNHQFKGNLKIVRRLFAVTLDPTENPTQAIVLKYDQPLFKSPTQKHQIAHEELATSTNESEPFLELTDASPFYVGWNNESRQMVMTKRFTRQTQMRLVALHDNVTELQQEEVREMNPQMQFTTWPIPKAKLNDLKKQAKNEIVTLFEPVTNPEMAPVISLLSYSKGAPTSQQFSSYPANLRYLSKIGEHLAPNLGGFVWPGSASN